MTPATRAPRGDQAGFSLVEALVSMAILTIGILGIAQVQILASNQNGMGRRTANAAALARDFVESAQRWSFDDERLEGHGCGVDLDDRFPVTEEMLGSKEIPKVKMDFTANSASISPKAPYQAEETDALSRGDYDGTALPRFLDPDNPPPYQLMWSVRDINPRDLAATEGCTAKILSVVVRFPMAGGYYGSVITTTVLYDPSQISLGGLPELI